MKKVRLILRIGAEIPDPHDFLAGFSVLDFIEEFKKHKLKPRRVWNMGEGKFTLLGHKRYCHGHDICEFYFLDSKCGQSSDFWLKDKLVLGS